MDFNGSNSIGGFGLDNKPAVSVFQNETRQNCKPLWMLSQMWRMLA